MTKNWEKEKECLRELYMVRRMKLTTVSLIMEQDHGFQASERAYKQKFKQWRWFKKTPHQRSPIAVPTDHGMPTINPEDSDENPPHVDSLYPMQSTHSSDRGSPRGMPPMEHHYAEYTHMPVLKYEHGYPSVSTLDMGYAPTGGHAQHHTGPVHHQGMTLGPYQGRGPQQVPLPSVAHLQQAALKEYFREAERRVEIGQYEQAEAACENAMRTLNWFKENRTNGSVDEM